MDTHPHPPADARRLGTALRRDAVYRELRRRLLAGELPARTRLREERLAAELEVSRTPVREALVRLHADHLLAHHADGGYQVSEPNLLGLRDLYEVRISLELRGLTRGLEIDRRHDVAILEPLRDSWRDLRSGPPDPDPTFVEVDESFHVALSRSAGNSVLTELLERVNARIRRVRMYDFLTEDRITVTIEQHLEIVESVLAGDLPRALAQMRRHVGVSMEVVERRAARALTAMALRREDLP